MKRNWTRRSLLGLCASAVVLGSGCGGRDTPSTRSVALQDFKVPVLEGWTMSRWQNQSVSFTKEVQGSKLILRVLCDHTKKGERLPRTSEDLVRDAQRDKAMMAGRLARDHIHVKTLSENQRTEFQGMPAVAAENIASTSKAVVHSKTLRFTNGRNLYVLSVVVDTPRGKAATPQAQSEAGAAWKAVTEGMAAA